MLDSKCIANLRGPDYPSKVQLAPEDVPDHLEFISAQIRDADTGRQYKKYLGQIKIGEREVNDSDVLEYSRDNVNSPFFTTDADQPHFHAANKAYRVENLKLNLIRSVTAITWAATVYRGYRVNKLFRHVVIATFLQNLVVLSSLQKINEKFRQPMEDGEAKADNICRFINLSYKSLQKVKEINEKKAEQLRSLDK